MVDALDMTGRWIVVRTRPLPHRAVLGVPRRRQDLDELREARGTADVLPRGAGAEDHARRVVRRFRGHDAPQFDLVVPPIAEIVKVSEAITPAAHHIDQTNTPLIFQSLTGAFCMVRS